jgi:hypothetical protein
MPLLEREMPHRQAGHERTTREFARASDPRVGHHHWLSAGGA